MRDHQSENLVAMGRRITAVRQQSGLTQQIFADAIGFAKRTLLKWERAEAEPSVGCVIALQREFHVDPYWLLNGPADEPRYVEADEEKSRHDQLKRQVKTLAISEGIKLNDLVVGEFANDLLEVPKGELELRLKELRKYFRNFAKNSLEG